MPVVINLKLPSTFKNLISSSLSSYPSLYMARIKLLRLSWIPSWIIDCCLSVPDVPSFSMCPSFRLRSIACGSVYVDEEVVTWVLVEEFLEDFEVDEEEEVEEEDEDEEEVLLLILPLAIVVAPPDTIS